MWLFWLLAAIVIMFGFVVFRGAPYVPSKRQDLTAAFTKLYPLAHSDTLVDIGSGDGIVLRQAASRAGRVVGYELNPILVLISRFLSRNQPNAEIFLADFWRRPLPPETTVVYVFGESRDIKRMAAMVQSAANQWQRPVSLISYGFAIPGYQPTAKHGAHYLYRLTPLQQ